MTAQEQTPGLRASRLAEVDGIVRAAAAASGRSSRHLVLEELRGRLHRAHDTCEQVDDAAWADYVTRLDRGVNELAVELARRDEPTAPGSGMLYVHATRLEIDGWVLRLDHARGGAPPGAGEARELAARAVGHLDAYRRGEATRAEVDRAVEDVRATAEA